MSASSLHPFLHYLRRLSGGRPGDSALDDVQLLHRFLTQRDESAFTTLVQRYGPMVWSLCVRRLGETPEAEDAFQATFLVLVRKASSLRGPELLGPWLYGVANRTALKLRGQRERRAARETSLTEQIAEEQPKPMDSDLWPILDEEINRLPTKYRLPVLLCYLQGLSSEEAAQRLGCAKGTVFSRLSRARDLLRRRLVRRGVEMSGAALAAVLAENAALRAAPSLALREMTIRTSLLLAAGAAGPSLSAPLAALVEGVVRSMFFSKVKFALIVVLAVGIAGAGAGLLGYRTDAEQPASKNSPKAATATPAGVAAKTKEKDDESKPPAPPPAVPDEKQRLPVSPEKLMQTVVSYTGLEDPRATLSDALAMLSRRYNLTFDINEKAFEMEQLPNVGQTLIVQKDPLPPMRTTLSTVLHKILRRVPAPSGVTYLIRRDLIEITTGTFVVKELRIRPSPDVPEGLLPFPPLVWEASEDKLLAQILPRLAEISGQNVIADPSAGEKLKTKITVQFRNVPIDTAVRLLANMAGLSVVRIDNVFYVTTAEKAKELREEQAKLNAAALMGGTEGLAPQVEPVPEKPKK
ncbi:MAG: sigma-70 family RNA polymerase sigma factor [Gemmataceae bacterium]